MKVMLSQFKPHLGDVNRNFEKHLEIIQKGIEESCDLVIFPELSLSGYYLRDLVTEVALKIDDKILDKFRELSERISIIAGFVLEDERSLIFNAAAYFEKGEILHLHKKVFLPNYTMFEESRYFASGDKFDAFQTKFGLNGILICEDALHLSSLYVLSQQGVKNLFVISNSPARGLYKDKFYSQELWGNSIRFIASNLTVNLCFVNRVGVEDGVSFWGGSSAYNALGDNILHMSLFDEESGICVFEEDVIRRARINSPFYRDEDINIVKNYLNRCGGKNGY